LLHLPAATHRHEVPSPPFVRLCSRTIQNGQRDQRHDYASGIGCRISSEPVNYEVMPLLIINISCPPSYQHLYPRSASETRPSFLTNINGGGGNCIIFINAHTVKPGDFVRHTPVPAQITSERGCVFVFCQFSNIYIMILQRMSPNIRNISSNCGGIRPNRRYVYPNSRKIFDH
jgi:hypothetical protein